MSIALPEPLTRAELDDLHCGDPACTNCAKGPVLVQGACHPGGALTALYEDGVITFNCHRCKKLVMRVSVMAPTMLETQAVQSLAMWADAFEQQGALVPVHVNEALDHARMHGLLPQKGKSQGVIVPQGPLS